MSTEKFIMVMTVINLLIAVVNIGILSQVIKLYTEYFKDRALHGKKEAA